MIQLDHACQKTRGEKKKKVCVLQCERREEGVIETWMGEGNVEDTEI